MKNNEINYPLIVLIFIQIGLVIFLSLSVPQLLKSNVISQEDYSSQPHMNIQDLSRYVADLRPENVQHIQQALLQAIIKTNKIDRNTKVVIREESVRTKHFNNQAANYFSAIMDLPQINAAYQILYEYSDTESSGQYDELVISCIEGEFCKKKQNQQEIKEFATRLLNYFEFNYFSAVIDEEDPSRIIISPMMDNPTSTEKAEYIKETQSAIESLGISPGLFKYYVMNPEDYTYYYDGG